MSVVPGGRNTEWLEHKTYAMGNLQPFDVLLADVAGNFQGGAGK